MNRTEIRRIGLLSMAGGLLLAQVGCNRDVRLAGRKVRTVEVGATSLFDVSLDASASPKQVAYVLLQAIREDFLAPDEAGREAALDKQFAICAANEIARRNKTGMGRDEFVHNVVYRWTPTVSHYVHNFDDQRERLESRMFVRLAPAASTGPQTAEECAVYMELEDPQGDPNARVVMAVWLAKDGGFWRVLHLGFDPTRRSLASARAAPSSAAAGGG